MPSTDDDVTDAYCRRQISGRRLVATDDAGRFVPPDCWAGADFRNMNLSGVYLFKANLSGANLCGANLSGAYLFKANLSGACLFKANLSWACLIKVDLSGADLGEWERGPDGYARRKEAK